MTIPCLTLHMVSCTCQVTPKHIRVYIFAFAVIYIPCIRYKQLHKVQGGEERMRIKTSKWVKPPIFFNDTCAYYNKTAFKALRRHINHSKPYNYEHQRLRGKTCSSFSTSVLTYILFITHSNAPSKALNSTSNRHIHTQNLNLSGS